MPRGRLIVFEGPEGAGKSTQLRLVADRFGREDPGSEVLVMREPGGTAVGDEIRRMLLDPASDIAPASEALLFMASRAQLVERRIRPALAAGAVVLLDRFFLSTYAYQGAGRGLPEDAIRAANALATEGLIPDLTVLLDLPIEDGLIRAFRRGGHDRMERAEREFHERVAGAFGTFSGREWQSAHPECGPVVLVDATGTPEEVFGRIMTTLRDRWPEIFPA